MKLGLNQDSAGLEGVGESFEVQMNRLAMQVAPSVDVSALVVSKTAVGPCFRTESLYFKDRKMTTTANAQLRVEG